MNLQNIKEQTKNQSWQEKLQFVAKNFSGIVFSTSFSWEDQIITSFIVKNKLPIAIFTIDTGRLFEQTYKIWQKTLDIYGVKISAFYPSAQSISSFVGQNGIDAFYNSKELRLNCCHIRKVEPLKQALQGKELWISGLRKEHCESRIGKDFFEYDANLKINKFYPLLDMSEADGWNYIKENNVPYNQLYKQGFTSIGCAPCSRAIEDGQPSRAGRWWWENDEKKECGLHR
jgi:phosphoadenosine phosphosulfate reductase